MSRLELVALVVRDYEPAIDFLDLEGNRWDLLGPVAAE